MQGAHQITCEAECGIPFHASIDPFLREAKLFDEQEKENIHRVRSIADIIKKNFICFINSFIVPSMSILFSAW